MRYVCRKSIPLAIGLTAFSIAWGQGTGRRGAAATPTTIAAQPAQGATGRGGTGRGGATDGPGANTTEFFNFDPTATQIRAGLNADAPPIETHQKITVNGQPLAYTAKAGFLPLLNATTGLPEAHLFYTSYAKEGTTDSATRPLMFCFGGAPGVSAAWQELGGLGPKRMKADGAITENSGTLLNQADLVFVNPVGTGFSYPAQPSRGPAFWNTSGDVSSLAEFVRVYINRNSRLTSPLFIVGEDPAIGRIAAMAEYLSQHMIPVRGAVMLSLAASQDAIAGDTQYITLLPSLVLSSWFHKKLSPELNAMSAEQIAGQARQFASREYLHALYKGDRMTTEERSKAAADLARLTGLSKSFVLSNDFRISLDRYNAELMRDQHRGLSRSDSRVTGYTPMGGGRGGGGGGRGFGAPQPPVDFYMNSVTAPFAAAYENYLRHELNFTANKEGIYYLTTGGIGPFTATGTEEVSLTGAFARNPDLQLFVSINFFDLGLPFYAAEYTMAHLDVAPEIRAHNITVSHQEAGSMAYMDEKALGKLERDLAAFVTRAAATK